MKTKNRIEESQSGIKRFTPKAAQKIPLNRGSTVDLGIRKTRTILVPVELDNRSGQLLLAAASFAEQLNARLVLLHVYQIKGYAPPCTTPQQFDDWIESLQKMAEMEMTHFRAAYAYNPAIEKAEVIVTSGFIEEEISRIAESSHADLVLVSSHAYYGIKRLFLGSKAEVIMRHAHCPVLVVPVPTVAEN